MRILIAEDDEATARFIANGLAPLYRPTCVSTGEEALASLKGSDFDIAILDRMMPTLDGLTVLQRLRAEQVTIPILLLTALGQIEDRVDGLEAGADDYLVKPFALSELQARLDAILRRRTMDAVPTSLAVGPLSLDILHREARIDGKIVALQPREMRLLEELMRNEGRIVTRTMLLERVWNFHFDPQTNIVETHMSRLRSKLALGGVTDMIETVRGAGYRLRDRG